MINFLDIGCAEDFDTRWDGFAYRLNYVGCDPDAAACEKLVASPPAAFAAHNYMAVAVTPETQQYKLYETQLATCSSLLEPNQKYLERFMFDGFFEVVGQSEVQGVSLVSLVDKIGWTPDVLKMDVQGLEMQIIESAPDICASALVIDCDVGFTRNYKNEAVFWEISKWMERNGFLLFDLQVNRVRRKAGNSNLDPIVDYINVDEKNSLSQPLWGSSIWVKDLVQMEGQADDLSMSKLISLCDHLKFLDYRDELIEKSASEKERM